jgi:hypothetical protein
MATSPRPTSRSGQLSKRTRGPGTSTGRSKGSSDEAHLDWALRRSCDLQHSHQPVTMPKKSGWTPSSMSDSKTSRSKRSSATGARRGRELLGRGVIQLPATFGNPPSPRADAARSRRWVRDAALRDPRRRRRGRTAAGGGARRSPRATPHDALAEVTGLLLGNARRDFQLSAPRRHRPARCRDGAPTSRCHTRSATSTSLRGRDPARQP